MHPLASHGKVCVRSVWRDIYPRFKKWVMNIFSYKHRNDRVASAACSSIDFNEKNV